MLASLSRSFTLIAMPCQYLSPSRSSLFLVFSVIPWSFLTMYLPNIPTPTALVSQNTALSLARAFRVVLRHIRLRLQHTVGRPSSLPRRSHQRQSWPLSSKTRPQRWPSQPSGNRHVRLHVEFRENRGKCYRDHCQHGRWNIDGSYIFGRNANPERGRQPALEGDCYPPTGARKGYCRRRHRHHSLLLIWQCAGGPEGLVEIITCHREREVRAEARAIPSRCLLPQPDQHGYHEC